MATVAVRDFCLLNQEKVSQPQILLRSSNFEVAQNVIGIGMTGGGLHRESLD